MQKAGLACSLPEAGEATTSNQTPQQDGGGQGRERPSQQAGGDQTSHRTAFRAVIRTKRDDICDLLEQKVLEGTRTVTWRPCPWRKASL